MRTIPFKEVLWAVAVKMGLDPTKDLHGEHADALAIYINSWVRRLWHVGDWPEWTRTKKWEVDSRHMVGWEKLPEGTVAGDVDMRLGRVLKVYLNDPEVTPPPLEITPRFSDIGIHCGFEHGRHVWIKFQPPAPQYTAKVWERETTYRRGGLAYSPESGECYFSRSGGNLGNNPAGMQGVTPMPLTVRVTQVAEPETPAIAGRSQITRVTQSQQSLGNYQTQHTWQILDGTGAVIGSATYTAAASEPAADILTAIFNLLDANPALSGFTFTRASDTPLALVIEADQWFSVRAYYHEIIPPSAEQVTTGGAPDETVIGEDLLVVTVGQATAPPIVTIYNTINNVQYFVQAVAFVPAKPQVIELQMSAQQAVAGASYELTFIDISGVLHPVQYVNPGQSSVAILQGLMNEIQASSDPFFNAMSTAIDPDLVTLTFASFDMVSLNTDIVPVSNAWWDRIEFALCLAEPVIRGGEADAIREEGQSDKANTEEVAAGSEASNEQAPTWQPLAFDPMTDQTRPTPRYKIAGAAPTQKG